MKEEIWLHIPDYIGYQISNLGRVRSIDRDLIYSDGRKRHMPGRILKPVLTDNGYFRIALHQKGSYRSYYIHRLVAATFVANPENKPIVNHIDGNKSNNCAENLEWVTYGENNDHAVSIGLCKHCTEIRCKETGKTYKSIRSAAKDLNLSHSSLAFALQNNKPIQGYSFEVVDS